MGVKVFCPAWLLVSIGLLMNVVAILLTSIILDKNTMQQLNRHEQQQQNVYLIQQAWNKLDILERKQEWLLLYLQSQEQQESLDQVALQQLAPWLFDGNDLSQYELDNTLAMFETARQDQRDRIDNWYLDNLRLQRQIGAYREEYLWYRNVALLLQIFGLALILSRDLGWRR